MPFDPLKYGKPERETSGFDPSKYGTPEGEETFAERLNLPFAKPVKKGLERYFEWGEKRVIPDIPEVLKGLAEMPKQADPFQQLLEMGKTGREIVTDIAKGEPLTEVYLKQAEKTPVVGTALTTVRHPEQWREHPLSMAVRTAMDLALLLGGARAAIKPRAKPTVRPMEVKPPIEPTEQPFVAGEIPPKEVSPIIPREIPPVGKEVLPAKKKPALKLKDGSIITSDKATLHAQLIREKNVNTNDVVSGGWMTDKGYIEAYGKAEPPIELPKKKLALGEAELKMKKELEAKGVTAEPAKAPIKGKIVSEYEHPFYGKVKVAETGEKPRIDIEKFYEGLKKEGFEEVPPEPAKAPGEVTAGVAERGVPKVTETPEMQNIWQQRKFIQKELAIKDADLIEARRKYFDEGRSDVAQKKWQGLEREVENLQKRFDELSDQYNKLSQAEAGKGGEVPPGKGKGLLRGEAGFARIPSREEIGAKTRKFITSVKERFPEIEGEVEGQYFPRSTDDLSIKAQNLIRDDIVSAEKLARTGIDEKAVATSAELIKHYTELAQKSITEGERIVFYDKAAEIANTIAPKLTELGRGVQSASILSRLTPEGQVRFAAQEIARYNEALKPWQKRVPDLTGEQTRYITEEMKRIREMPDGEGRAIAFWNLQTYIADLVPSSWYKKIVNLWKAGLLTGIKTTGLNLLATHWNSTLEILKDIPAVTLDKLIPGKRTIAFTTKGIGRGTISGLRKGWRYFKTGYDERNIGIKLDYRRVNYGKSKFGKASQFYVDHIFRAMGAEDQPFFYGARNRSLYSQAIAQAKNRGLKGLDAKDFVEQLVQNPTDDMLKNAIMDAEIAVHQNKTLLGEAGRTIQKIPGGEFVIPFSRTPAAVAMQMVNYSPAGIVKTIVGNIGKGRFDRRLFIHGISRGLTGTAILYVGKELFEKGMMTLDYPRSEREQKQWELEGKKPNSIKIGGKWRGANTLGPAGLVMLVGGHFKQGMDESGSPWGGITKAMIGSGKSLSEQTFLRGLNSTVEALNNPERFTSGYLQSTVGSAVPTIVGDVARAIETKERRIESPLESIISRIPFARGTLEPKIDVMGKELERGGTFLETMIDPTRPSKIKDSPIVNELRRLWNEGYKVTPTQLGDRKGFKALTSEQNTKLWKVTGSFIEQKLNILLSLPEYQTLPDDKKAKLIDQIIDKSKTMTRVAMVKRLIQGLSGDELIIKFRTLKEGGLLTREILEQVLKGNQ